MKNLGDSNLFFDAIQDLEKDKISQIISSSSGFYIVRLKDRIQPEREEFEEKDEIFSTSDTDFMAMPSNEVMYGSPHHVIDEMPQMARMLIEDQSFISFGNRLFRMVDPEAQAASYLASRKLVIKKNKAVELIPIRNSNCLGGYEFENGGGIDEEEVDEWSEGGKGPALLSFTRDIMMSG